MSNPEVRTRHQKLLDAALDQPHPTPELVAALALFVAPKKRKPKRIRTKSTPMKGIKRRILPMTPVDGEFCRWRVLGGGWCRRHGEYYGQWMGTTRNKNRKFFSKPLCEEHAEEYAQEYGLRVERIAAEARP